MNAIRYAFLFLGTIMVAACDDAAHSVPLQTTSIIGSIKPTANETKLWGANVAPACRRTTGEAQCLALFTTFGRRANSGPMGGFTPAQLQAAYGLSTSSRGNGEVVAIVDAFDNPNIASDLAEYRSFFKLPAANFTKYNQAGKVGSYPAGDTGWGFEEDLDVDMVSASCPNCTIYLIEANSQNGTDLQAAVAEAVTLGAKIVSNSYVCFTPCGFENSYYDTPGVTYLASSGDYGYGTGVGTPAAYGSVIAVGGTSLYSAKHTRRGFHETAWLGTGSGCATGYTKPKWQHDSGCAYRTTNDIAALADPATGPSIYDSYGANGWLVGGGTSTSAPFLAGVFALAGNASSQVGAGAFWRERNERRSKLFAVEKGYNGVCSPSYLCTDGTHEYKGYGGPTGWGTPNGIGAF
jgi:subtilase family serine protease